MAYRSAVIVSFIVSFISTLPASVAAPGDVINIENSEQASFQLVEVADGFEFAWDIAFLPDGRLLVSEYDGRIKLVQQSEDPPAVIQTGLDVTERGGLRGISPHPDFASNNWLYFCFASGPYAKNRTHIARGRLINESIEVLENLYIANNESPGLAHYGCRLNWLEDGTLLATLGDRRDYADQAQDLSNNYGTIIRLHDDGSVPADQPFASRPGARKEISAYGIRNIQGAAFHPDSGDLWFADHGPLGGDEINIYQPGLNYGWPIATFGIDYDGTVITETSLLPNVEPPLFYWYPSIAPSSLAFYTGTDFPKWRSDLFVGTLAGNAIYRLELVGNRIVAQEKLLEALRVRIRDVVMGPDGFMYVLTDRGDGRLFRIAPAE